MSGGASDFAVVFSTLRDLCAQKLLGDEALLPSDLLEMGKVRTHSKMVHSRYDRALCELTRLNCMAPPISLSIGACVRTTPLGTCEAQESDSSSQDDASQDDEEGDEQDDEELDDEEAEEGDGDDDDDDEQDDEQDGDDDDDDDAEEGDVSDDEEEEEEEVEGGSEDDGNVESDEEEGNSDQDELVVDKEIPDTPLERSQRKRKKPELLNPSLRASKKVLLL